jgi:hypothetical protein
VEAQLVQDVIYLNNVSVNGQMPLIAARLCNFATGDSALRAEHLVWINRHLKNATAASPDAWIDIQAYASRTGSDALNQALSDRRRVQVKAGIAAAIPSARFLKEKAWGESASGGGENDNDGYWRAVEVYAFGSLPRARFPDPAPARPILPIIGGPSLDADQWFVTNLSLSGVSIVPVFGGGGLSGTITFEHVGSPDEPDFMGAMVLVGMAVGASEGIPGLKKSKLAQKILKFIADNGGLSYGNAPSATEGICFPNAYKVSRLQSFDFSGDCATIFVSGNLGPGGSGLYLLFFGLPTGFWFWPSTLALISGGLIGPDIASHCKGAAVISSLGVGLSGSVGVAVNGMYGRIS